MSETKIYTIQHSFKKEIIIPIVALHNNLHFLMSNGNKLVKTSDNYICNVTHYRYKHICELEKDVQRLYNIDVWSFIKRWYNAIPYIDSMMFINMFLEEYEAREG
jgi:hypothetical protein